PIAGTQAGTVKRILRQAADNYDATLAEAGELPELLEGKARVLSLFSEVYLAGNDSRQAAASARSAVALWQRLGEADAADRDRRAGLALAQHRLGVALAVQGDSGGALAAHEAALGLRRGLAEERPDDPDALAGLAASLALAGDVRKARGEEGGDRAQ